MDKLWILKEYFSYCFSAKTKYSIHSPFVYQFIINVIEKRTINPETSTVEQIREDLIGNKEVIEITDYGAANRANPVFKRKVSCVARNTSKSRKYARLLYNIAQYFKPAVMLELGTSLGISTMYIAKGNPDGKMFTIEGSETVAAIAGSNFQKLSLNNIKQYTGNFDSILFLVLKEIKKVDFVFFDGNHQKEATIRYFEQCLAFADNDSVFIFDDIRWSKGMKEAWNHICSHPSVTCCIDLFAVGIVFFRKEFSKQYFVLKY